MLFLETLPPPPGVSVEKPDGFSKSITEMANLNLLVLNRAFEAIQGILQTFSTESSYRGKSITKVELVAPGMTVFISIRSDVWKNKGFFNNDSIAQYLFIVKSFFSLEQAGDIAKFNSLLAYEELMAAYRTRMYALADTIADPNTPFSALTELDEQLGYYAGQIGKIQAMIDDLHSQKMAEKLKMAKHAIISRAKSLN